MDIVYSEVKISCINFAFLIVMCHVCFHPCVIGEYISEPANIVVLGYVLPSVCLLTEIVD